MNEYIVTMQSVAYTDVSDTVLVEGEDLWGAIVAGFGTRNIASSWQITEIVTPHSEVKLDEPITYEWYERKYHQFPRQVWF